MHENLRAAQELGHRSELVGKRIVGVQDVRAPDLKLGEKRAQRRQSTTTAERDYRRALGLDERSECAGAAKADDSLCEALAVGVPHEVQDHILEAARLEAEHEMGDADHRGGSYHPDRMG